MSRALSTEETKEEMQSGVGVVSSGSSSNVVTDVTLVVMASVAKFLSNAGSTSPHLPTEKSYGGPGWTEVWGGSTTAKTDDEEKKDGNWSVENEVVSWTLQSSRMRPSMSAPLVLVQFRVAWYEQLVLRMYDVPHIVVNSAYSVTEISGALPFLVDYSADYPAVVGRWNPTGTITDGPAVLPGDDAEEAKSSPPPTPAASDSHVVDYLRETGYIPKLQEAPSADATVYQSLIQHNLRHILLALRYADGDAWRQVYRPQYIMARVDPDADMALQDSLAQQFRYYGCAGFAGSCQAWSERVLHLRSLVAGSSATGDILVSSGSSPVVNVPRALQRVRRYYSALEERLTPTTSATKTPDAKSTTKYLLDESPSLVDAMLFAHLADALCDVHLVVVLAEYPHLVNFFKVMYETYFHHAPAETATADNKPPDTTTVTSRGLRSFEFPEETTVTTASTTTSRSLPGTEAAVSRGTTKGAATMTTTTATTTTTSRSLPGLADEPNPSERTTATTKVETTTTASTTTASTRAVRTLEHSESRVKSSVAYYESLKEEGAKSISPSPSFDASEEKAVTKSGAADAAASTSSKAAVASAAESKTKTSTTTKTSTSTSSSNTFSTSSSTKETSSKKSFQRFSLRNSKLMMKKAAFYSGAKKASSTSSSFTSPSSSSSSKKMLRASSTSSSVSADVAVSEEGVEATAMAGDDPNTSTQEMELRKSRGSRSLVVHPDDSEDEDNGDGKVAVGDATQKKRKSETAAKLGTFSLDTALPEGYPEEKEDIIALFDKYDANRNGYMSVKERDSMMKAEPFFADFMSLPKKVRTRAFDLADKTGKADGRLSQKEFLTFMEFLPKCSMLWKVFDAVDVNNDKKITVTEFRKGLVILGIDESVASEVFAEIDTNSSGRIDFDEFFEYFKGKIVADLEEDDNEEGGGDDSVDAIDSPGGTAPTVRVADDVAQDDNEASEPTKSRGRTELGGDGQEVQLGPVDGNPQTETTTSSTTRSLTLGGNSEQTTRSVAIPTQRKVNVPTYSREDWKNWNIGMNAVNHFNRIPMAKPWPHQAKATWSLRFGRSDGEAPYKDAVRMMQAMAIHSNDLASALNIAAAQRREEEKLLAARPNNLVRKPREEKSTETRNEDAEMEAKREAERKETTENDMLWLTGVGVVALLAFAVAASKSSSS